MVHPRGDSTEHRLNPVTAGSVVRSLRDPAQDH